MRAPEEVAALHGWRASWRGLRVAVLGLGVTGFSVVDTLAELGANQLVLASGAKPELVDLLAVLGVRLVLGDLDGAGRAAEPAAAGSAAAGAGEILGELTAFAPELVVVSPGFPPSHRLVRWAGERGIPVWGDVELAWRLRDKTIPAKWLAVTGTNGKTTTVQLTTAMIAAGGLRVAACGNVGTPVLDAIRDPAGFDVLVIELSSFQLHYVQHLEPYSSVCLNVADDHLDWHGSAAAYRRAKAKVYENTTAVCLYNRSDPTTRSMVEQAEVAEGCRAVGFGLDVPGAGDLGVVDGILCDRAFHADRQRSAVELLTVAELRPVGLAGPHLQADVLAASALARSVGVPPSAIGSAVRAFHVDHHRTEVIAEAAGVRWVDDSKATNPHAAQAALAAFDSVVWIVGGLLKGVDIAQLVAGQAGRLTAAVVIGADRSAVLAAFARHAPELPVFEVTTLDTDEVMPTAVRLAASAARSGDTVLLAPAAASMDQFSNYADRGRRFAQAVHDRLGGGADDDEPAPSATPPKP